MGQHYPPEFESSVQTTALQYIFYIFIITVSVVVTAGNSLVILTMITQKKLQTPPHLYLGSLAVIDLSVGIFILPLRIIQVMNDQEWRFGASLCGIFVTADVTLCTLSIYHLIAIAADRYRAITHGIRYVQHRSFGTVCVTIGFLWAISLWVSTPPALGWNDEDWGLQNVMDEKEQRRSYCNMTRNKGYVFHSVLGSFIIPIFTITLLYYKIYVAIRIKLRKRARPASMMGKGGGDQRSDYQKSVGETSDTYSSEDLLEQGAKINKEFQLQGNKTKSATFPRRIKFRLTQMRRSIIPTTSSSSGNDQDDAQTNPETQLKTEEEAEGDNNAHQEASGSSTSTNSGITKSILRMTKIPVKSPRPVSQVEEFVRKKIKFSLTKERRAVRTLGVIIFSFLICWIPFCILYITDAFFYPVADRFETLFEICTWMGYVNSGMNPFIYSIFNRDFRIAFSKFLFFCKKS